MLFGRAVLVLRDAVPAGGSWGCVLFRCCAKGWVGSLTGVNSLVPPAQGQRLSKVPRNCPTFGFYPIVSTFPLLKNSWLIFLAWLLYFCVFFPPDSEYSSPYACVPLLSGLSDLSCSRQVWVALPWHVPLFSAPCSSKLCNHAAEICLKNLPYSLPHPFFFRFTDWFKVYLSAIQVSLFCRIYPVHKYNEISWEKHYLINKNTTLCLYHTEGSWELSKCTMHVPKFSPEWGPKLGCSASSAFSRKLWFLSHPII